MIKDLNIVTLNVPYPPDYGGMIDSYYRIKWLKEAGINIHLHCFQYGRLASKELEMLCENVCYYRRHTGPLSLFSRLPFIIKSRDSMQLLETLKSNDYPILFDGLHTTYYLNHPDLALRNKSVRLHNIEHLYYNSLADFEKNRFRKFYLNFESRKLRKYEGKIRSTVNLFTISRADFYHFTDLYKNVVLLPPFHPYNENISITGNGEYILYHGDLSVAENSIVAISLIKNVFSGLKYNCIVAGKNPPQSLLQLAGGMKNLRIIADPDKNTMEDLIRNAHVNLLPVLTSNGFKLKHLFALFAGRFCVVNQMAALNLEDKSLIQIANSDKEMINTINKLMEIDFSNDMILKRKDFLEKLFSNKSNTQKLIDTIFS